MPVQTKLAAGSATAAAVIVAAVFAACTSSSVRDSRVDTDVIVVGAGIAGISAALEAAASGGTVLVIDMASVFGGHAVMSEGGLSITGSALQSERNVPDSPDLAYSDFIRWGEDADEAWVRDYVDHSAASIYDWVTSMGVQFTDVQTRPGNSVPRFHLSKGRGLGLVAPLYRRALQTGNIRFLWNHEVTELLGDVRGVHGLKATDLRSGKPVDFHGRAVILATGGFQSNLSLLREHWPATLKFPGKVLLGSGVNSVGSGLTLTQRAGGALARMDHQWNYPWGLPDPRYPNMSRGLSARNTASIWVNREGQRFVNETVSPKIAVPALLEQRDATYWAIFDDSTKRFFWIAGTDWLDFGTIDRVIFSNRELVKTAGTVQELAVMIGVPPDQLRATVDRYNALVAAGDDTDFGRFGPSSERYKGMVIPAHPATRIETPPFYAIQFFLLTRKSMGGVAIDRECRVVTENGSVIPGLYAAGELTGLAGINGKAGLEGTFLGPSILTGRVAGRAAMAAMPKRTAPGAPAPARAVLRPASSAMTSSESCLECHDLPKLIQENRRGYWHFTRSHAIVMQRGDDCRKCHAELHPYDPRNHQIDRMAQVDTCGSCHGGQ